MAAARYVLLGLARARSEWFRSVALWATSAAIPAEFVKCVSLEEVRAHLAGGRPFSAALLDAGLPHVDRDLLAAIRDAGCVPFVVDTPGSTRDWPSIGAAAVLPATLTRDQLIGALGTHAAMIGRGAVQPAADPRPLPPSELAPVVAVCGPGGTGASTVAIALAQGLAMRGGNAAPVLLADLCLHAEQAMLHDARDIVPGVQELVEAHRGRRPTVDEIHGLTFDVRERGYHLLLGLRRARYWSAIRPRAFQAAFEGIRGAFSTVVCDVTADFEGERHSGSADVEERNLAARTAVMQAGLVIVVGLPDFKHLYGMNRVIGELLELGVPARRILPVCNRAPRSPKARARMTRAVACLAGSLDGEDVLSSPLFLPRRRTNQALHDGVALPAAFVVPLVRAHDAALGRAAAEQQPLRLPEAEPQLVVPGSLGSWTAQEAEG